jgi:hypothetical protein
MNDPTDPPDPAIWNAEVQKIVRHYLGRLEALLHGLPESDRRELVNEVFFPAGILRPPVFYSQGTMR